MPWRNRQTSVNLSIYTQPVASVMITSASREGPGQELKALAIQNNILAPTGSAWQSASRATFVPIFVPDTVTFTRLLLLNGDAVSGNVDVGIYDSSGVRRVSTGSVAHAGVSVVQEFVVASTTLEPGWYYFAVVLDNAVGKVVQWSGDTIDSQYPPIRVQATAFPLPANAVFADYGGIIAKLTPVVGLCRRSFL